MPSFQGQEPPVSACLEPIAIVGMGCRWPGDSESASELWNFLYEKRDGYGRIPSDRINVDSFYHPDDHRPGSFYTEGGCFLKSDVRSIDHTFFNIHPKEVASLDPAQRKFVEVVYEAFESAGITVEQLAGSKTGTFVGNFNYDHQLMQYRDAEYPQAYAVTGGGITVLSNRINYIFDLKGPSMTLDTACSSSMYALHMACEAIHSGDCTGAVVGGSNLILTPECQVFSSALGAVSPTSRCHTFDVEADGYARADGIGALYIKKLSEAIKDRDPIRAVIRATAVNANGKTGGITHPSPDGQEAVIQRAYERAGGLNPAHTGYFECHGTGTAVGDPIETEAVGRVFAEGRTPASPLYIGSIKTNLGHSEPSSGIAGIMKAVLALEHGIIPPTIGLKTLNPNLNLWDNRLSIVTENTPWPKDFPVRRASVNSFGYGGANAHTILESVESVMPGYTKRTQVELSGHNANSSIEVPQENGTANDLPNQEAPRPVSSQLNGHTNGVDTHKSLEEVPLPNYEGVNGHQTNSPNGSNGYSADVSPDGNLVNGNHHDGVSNNSSSSVDQSKCGLANGVTNGEDRGTRETNSVSLAAQDADLKSYTNGQLGAATSVSSDSLGRRHFLLPFTSHDERTLRKNIEALAETEISSCLRDVVFTLSTRRSLMASRSYATVSRHDVGESLAAAAGGTLRKAPNSPPNVGFVFTGQGAQWPQMGLALMSEFPQFVETILELDSYVDAIDPMRSWTLGSLLRASPESSTINEAECSQPIVTAVQIGLVELLRNWGIYPAAVAGHSSGEIAASYSAGLTSKREAIVAAYLRGKVVATNQSQGAMLAVGLGATEVEPYVQPYHGMVAIGCHNSPASCTLSGDTLAIAKIKTLLEKDKVFARELRTGGNAYHSHHMKVLGRSYEDAMYAVGASPRSTLNDKQDDSPTKRPIFFSSVHGAQHQGLLGPTYWRSNMESPVLFAEAAAQMIETMDLQLVVEIGPHSALQGPLRQIIQSLPGQVDYLPSILRKSDNIGDILSLAGELFTRGFPVDLRAVNGLDDNARVVVDLPHYRWQYEGTPILTENRWTREWRLREHPRHDILGSRIPGGVKSDPTWRNILRIQDIPWLAQHCIGTDPVMPSAAYISMVFEAVIQVVEVSGASLSAIKWLEIQDMSLSQALLLNHDDAVETMFSMKPIVLNNNETYESRYEFQFVSVQGETGDVFTEHCRGSVEVGFEHYSRGSSELIHKFDHLAEFHKGLSVSQWYERFAQIGLSYGPPFQGLLKLLGVGSTNMTGSTITSNPPVQMMKRESRYIIHPATLDAVLQLAMISSHSNKPHKMTSAYMPVKISSMVIRPQEYLGRGINVVSEGVHKGVRGLSADLAVRGSENAFLEASVFFLRSDQHVAIPEVGLEPYTRIVWKPQFSSLEDDTVASLFPPITLTEDAVIPSLNALALLQLASFYLKNRELFQQGSKEPHLNRLLQWTEEKLTALKGESAQILESEQEWREAEIAKREHSLNPHSSESRLMCHLYHNLEDIYAGKKTGIQVALQDNLLIDNYEQGQVYREGNRRLGKVVELLANERPGLKIFEVGAGTGSATREVVRALHGDTSWRAYSRYHFTDTTPSFLASAETSFADYDGMTYGTFDMEKDAASQEYNADWDLVIASNVIHATSDIRHTLQNIRSLLKPGGRMILLELTQSQLSAGLVLGTFSDFWKADSDPEFPRYDGPFLSKDMWRAVLPTAGFTGLDFHLDDYAGDNRSATVLCATAAELASQDKPSGISLIYRGESQLVDAAAKKLLDQGISVDRLPVWSCGTFLGIRHKRVVFMLELDEPFFTTTTQEEWKGFQYTVTSAQSILWVSAGRLHNGGDPAFAMISGIIRGLKTEMSTLRFGSLDVDDQSRIPQLVRQFEQKVHDAGPGDDLEFRRSGDVTFVSRLLPDVKLNNESRAVREQSLTTEDTSLVELSNTPIRIDIEKPGVLSTIYFRKDGSFAAPLPDDEVEIKVLAAGVNNKDIAVVTGRHHSDTFSDECAGRVYRVGQGVTTLRPGDLVQCLSFAKFGNFVRDKAIFCSKMHRDDSVAEAATLPIAFGTAIYGLMELGRLSEGESVLIQSATGAVGLAAIQIAHHCGAEIFATVGTEDKKQVLLDLGIKEDHIFWSRERRSVLDMMDATGGRGIDVVLCSARGQLMHEYWKCIAPSGRFIEIGRTEVLEGGQIDLDVFRRNAMFASFDLEVLSTTKPRAVSKIMTQIAELRAAGAIKPLPHKLYHLSEIEKALATFAKAVHIGKLILTYTEDDDMPIKYRHSPFKASFDPEAVYLLVGCLGGLGRAFSKWAVERGAQHLLFLSRSGGRSPEAIAFLSELQKRGVDAKVIRGDVASYTDVEAAVQSTALPIKGVVQAALTLHDGLFESMSLEQFRATVDTRVTGTANLHRALQGQPLGFFQMWSSWTLMFGTATQSNYLASNAYMDAFARFRHAQGQPATSLSLSQVLGVGIVSYMPEYQQAMIRNGFYGNNEEEFLAYCEAGIEPDTHVFEHDPNATSHLLVGIEPAGLVEVGKTYPLDEMVWATDPRFRQLLHSTDLIQSSSGVHGTAKQDDSEGGSLEEQIRVKISRLLYVPTDDITMDKAINAYGFDSMVAAELRNWLFAKFAHDVSLLSLLSSTMTIEKLAETVSNPSE